MSHLRKQTHIYYYVLKGNLKILADERDKKRLLDIVLEVHQGHSILAFCVTDEEAVFLECAGDIREIREKTERVQDAYGAYLDGRKEKNTGDVPGLSLAQLQEIPASREAILECTRRIHRLPKEKGYVQKISDYWWSSYPPPTPESMDGKWWIRNFCFRFLIRMKRKPGGNCAGTARMKNEQQNREPSFPYLIERKKAKFVTQI